MTSRGVIFWRTLRDARWIVLGWGVAIGLMTLLIMIIFPTMTQFEALADLVNSPIYKALLGEAADGTAFFEPEGFYAGYVVIFTPIYIAVYMVLLGLGATAGEEDRNTMDLLLSTSTPRWQIVVEKFLAIIVIILLLLLINLLFSLVGRVVTPEMAIPVGRLIEGNLSMLPISLVMASFALLFGTLLRSRLLAGGLTGIIIVASYMLTTLSNVATEALGTLKYLSFFSYHRGMAIMFDGMQWGDFLILLVVSLILGGLAVVAFQRRDIYA